MTDEPAYAANDDARKAEYRADAIRFGRQMAHRLLVKGPENGAGPDGVSYRRWKDNQAIVRSLNASAGKLGSALIQLDMIDEGTWAEDPMFSRAAREQAVAAITKYAADVANFALFASHPDRMALYAPPADDTP